MPTLGASPSPPRELPFQPRDPQLPVESFPLAHLRARFDLAQVGPERLRMHLVVLTRGGHGVHEVDFTPVTMRRACLLHVLPGQIHRWADVTTEEATVLLLPEHAVAPPRDTAAVRHRSLTDTALARAERVLDLTQQEISTPLAERDPRLFGALTALIVAALALDDTWSGPSTATGPPSSLWTSILAVVRAQGSTRLTVEGLAAQLGYSPRTVSRTCHAVAGTSPKHLIDEHTYLRARRLLVEPTTTISDVARALGFIDTSNFVAFFRRLSGTTPARWRATNLPGP